MLFTHPRKSKRREALSAVRALLVEADEARRAAVRAAGGIDEGEEDEAATAEAVAAAFVTGGCGSAGGGGGTLSDASSVAASPPPGGFRAVAAASPLSDDGADAAGDNGSPLAKEPSSRGAAPPRLTDVAAASNRVVAAANLALADTVAKPPAVAAASAFTSATAPMTARRPSPTGGAGVRGTSGSDFMSPLLPRVVFEVGSAASTTSPSPSSGMKRRTNSSGGAAALTGGTAPMPSGVRSQSKRRLTGATSSAATGTGGGSPQPLAQQPQAGLPLSKRGSVGALSVPRASSAQSQVPRAGGDRSNTVSSAGGTTDDASAPGGDVDDDGAVDGAAPQSSSSSAAGRAAAAFVLANVVPGLLSQHLAPAVVGDASTVIGAGGDLEGIRWADAEPRAPSPRPAAPVVCVVGIDGLGPDAATPLTVPSRLALPSTSTSTSTSSTASLPVSLVSLPGGLPELLSARDAADSSGDIESAATEFSYHFEPRSVVPPLRLRRHRQLTYNGFLHASEDDDGNDTAEGSRDSDGGDGLGGPHHSRSTIIGGLWTLDRLSWLAFTGDARLQGGLVQPRPRPPVGSRGDASLPSPAELLSTLASPAVVSGASSATAASADAGSAAAPAATSSAESCVTVHAGVLSPHLRVDGGSDVDVDVCDLNSASPAPAPPPALLNSLTPQELGRPHAASDAAPRLRLVDNTLSGASRGPSDHPRRVHVLYSGRYPVTTVIVGAPGALRSPLQRPAAVRSSPSPWLLPPVSAFNAAAARLIAASRWPEAPTATELAGTAARHVSGDPDCAAALTRFAPLSRLLTATVGSLILAPAATAALIFARGGGDGSSSINNKAAVGSGDAAVTGPAASGAALDAAPQSVTLQATVATALWAATAAAALTASSAIADVSTRALHSSSSVAITSAIGVPYRVVGPFAAVDVPAAGGSDLVCVCVGLERAASGVPGAASY